MYYSLPERRECENPRHTHQSCVVWHPRIRTLMPTEFTFGDGHERISVRIEASNTKHQPDKNRLESTVNLGIGAFSGAFKAEFAISDLVLLHEQLIRAFAWLSEIITFKNAEGDISLSIEINGPGGAIVTGTIQPHRLRQSSLSFRLDIPQSALARTTQELEDVLREFPPQATRAFS